MRGFWSQVVTLGVIFQIALVSGKALIQYNQQTQQQQQLEENSKNSGIAQRREGYDYPAPPNDLVSPFQDHDDLHADGDHHEVVDHGHHDEHHNHHDHHDPGYWKKKLIWKPGWQKIWKPSKKQIWKPSWVKVWKLTWKRDYKDIWVPGVKKIWRPVWISEWFPSPDHHEHVHESHGWDRSDKNEEANKRIDSGQQQQQSRQSDHNKAPQAT